MKDYLPELTKQLLAKCKQRSLRHVSRAHLCWQLEGCNEVEAATHLTAALLALTPPLMARGVKAASALLAPLMARGVKAASALLALTPAITAKGGIRAVRRLKLIYSSLCTGHTLLDHYIFYKPTR